MHTVPLVLLPVLAVSPELPLPPVQVIKSCKKVSLVCTPSLSRLCSLHSYLWALHCPRDPSVHSAPSSVPSRALTPQQTPWCFALQRRQTPASSPFALKSLLWSWLLLSLQADPSTWSLAPFLPILSCYSFHQLLSLLLTF